MRKIIITLSIIFITAGLSAAQTTSRSFQNAEKNYLKGLRHVNQGVVESAIINTMILKLYHPQKECKQIIEKLDSLSLENPEKTIRLKAFIASNYLKHPEQYNWIEGGDYEQAIKFFHMYSKRLEEQVTNKRRAVSHVK